MRMKITLLLILAALLAGGAGLVSFVYLGAVGREVASARAALASYGDIVKVPVLLRDVAAGEVLRPEDFTEHPIPREYLPGDALESLPDLPEGGSLQAFDAIAARSLLLTRMIGVAGPEGPARLVLPEGRGALLVPVANLAAVRAQLETGTRVDLFALRVAEGASEVRLLAVDFEVLALPAPADPAAGPQPAATALMLAGPEADLARVILARQGGEIHLTLSAGARAISDNSVVISESELADLPLARRAGGATALPVVAGQSRMFTRDGDTAQGQMPSAVSVPVLAPGAGDGTICTAALVRGGQRVQVEVPC